MFGRRIALIGALAVVALASSTMARASPVIDATQPSVFETLKTQAQRAYDADQGAAFKNVLKTMPLLPEVLAPAPKPAMATISMAVPFEPSPKVGATSPLTFLRPG